jgi:DNA integrity scanning protein DisA with diadenylate cyclase activity
MKTIEYDLLLLFKKNPEKEFSTNEILSSIFSDEYKEINSVVNDILSSKEQINAAKRKKGQLHRKMLYYLNNLIKDEILKLSRQGNKGEKYFKLAIEENEEIVINRSRRKIIISKPSMPAMPIDGYEQKNIASRFEQATWVDKLNSIIIEAKRFKNLQELYNTINKCFSNVNDVIGLNDFEYLIQNNDTKEVISTLRKINSDCIDYGRRVSFIIRIRNIEKNKEVILADFIKEYCDMNSDGLNLIFDISSKDIIDKSNLFESISESFISSRKRMNIKNSDICKSPYILGRAGPYSFNEEEWLLYEKDFQKNSYGLACSQSTVCVDVKKFFSEYKNASNFRIFVKNIVKSLLSANSLQRRKSDEYFKEIVKLSFPHVMQFFSSGRNYVRFWNYGWKDPDLDQNYVIDLIKSTKEQVDNFCISEETIYKSCGMPTRFKVAFSCLFNKASRSLSERQFERIQIKKLENLYSNQIKDLLSVKEEIFNAFDGGDIARFYRVGKLDPKESLRELNIILNTYKIPFFSYDFQGINESDLKLTSFMGE